MKGNWPLLPTLFNPNWRPVDKSTLFYHLGILALMAPLSLLLRAGLASYAVNVAGIVVTLGLVRWAPAGSPGLVGFLRKYYPLFFFLPIYKQVGSINRLWCGFEWDPILSAADQAIFGFQPSHLWMKSWPTPLISEIFHFAYFTYYFQFAAMALILGHKKKEQQALGNYMAALCGAFYVCNGIFLFMPALGPQASLGHAEVASGYLFTDIMRWIYRWEIPGGHFPSAHVALTTVVILTSWRLRIGRPIFMVLGILLIGSTVYCGYHYAVDVLGGMVVGLMAFSCPSTPRSGAIVLR